MCVMTVTWHVMGKQFIMMAALLYHTHTEGYKNSELSLNLSLNSSHFLDSIQQFFLHLSSVPSFEKTNMQQSKIPGLKATRALAENGYVTMAK